jgi:hypothetical protein
MISVEGRGCLVIIADWPCPGATSGFARHGPLGSDQAMPEPGWASGEDTSHIRTGSSAQVMATLRNMGIAIHTTAGQPQHRR